MLVASPPLVVADSLLPLLVSVCVPDSPPPPPHAICSKAARGNARRGSAALGAARNGIGRVAYRNQRRAATSCPGLWWQHVKVCFFDAPTMVGAMRSPRWFRPAIVAIAVALGLALVGSHVHASNKYLELPDVQELTRSPAHRYANMGNDEVLAELRARGVPFMQTAAPQPGVRLPIRLTGRIHGVWIHSVLPEAERATTPFEILDGRLALALDDFSKILERHDIVEVIHFTMYRPAQTATHGKDVQHFRHPGGLAIDVGALKKRSGHWLAVGPHWPSQIGGKTCGTGARSLLARRGRELMSIVCEAADQRIFHFTLTPHFDQAHADHLHMEIKPGVKWFLIN